MYRQYFWAFLKLNPLPCRLEGSHHTLSLSLRDQSVHLPSPHQGHRNLCTPHLDVAFHYFHHCPQSQYFHYSYSLRHPASYRMTFCRFHHLSGCNALHGRF